MSKKLAKQLRSHFTTHDNVFSWKCFAVLLPRRSVWFPIGQRAVGRKWVRPRVKKSLVSLVLLFFPIVLCSHFANLYWRVPEVYRNESSCLSPVHIPSNRNKKVVWRRSIYSFMLTCFNLLFFLNKSLTITRSYVYTMKKH